MPATANHPGYYDKNIRLLKKHQPQAWEAMHDFTPDTVHDVYITGHGNTNLRVIGPEDQLITMHQNPESGSPDDNFLEYIPENSTGFVCILGMGLGHGPLAVARNRQQVQGIAVFELDPGIFHTALHHTDLADLLSDPRLLLSVSAKPDITRTLSAGKSILMLESIHTLRHLPSFIYNKDYEKVKDQVFDFVNGLNVGGNTSLHYGETFITNRFKNIETIHHNYLLEKLRDRFRDTPAFLVAGGPSLDGNIHHLVKVQGKGIILAVDSVLPTLLEHGITPDFVTAIDPQNLAFEKFAPVMNRKETHDISLICTPWVSSKVPRIFPAGKTFWAFSANPMEAWLNKIVRGSLLTGGAATVAHLNMQAAIFMGCSPIIFVGQDLAYPGKKDHARGTVLTHKDSVDRLLNSNNNPDLIWADSTNGEKIPTNRSLFFMKKHFEEMIRNSPGTYINASEGGINIEGTTPLSLNESINRYCTENKNIHARIHSAEIESSHPDPADLIEEFTTLSTVVKEVKRLIDSTSKSTKIVLREIRKRTINGKKARSISDLPKQLQSRIGNINNGHRELDRKQIWHILSEATLATKRDTDRLRLEVRRLEGKPDGYIQWLAKSLQLLEEINSERIRVLNLLEGHILPIIEFMKREQKLIKSPKSKTSLLELARLYFREKHLSLLEKTLNHMIPDTEASAEVHFYRGIIAALRTDHGTADEHFSQAIAQDIAYQEKIRDFRVGLAEEYRAFRTNTIIDSSAKRKMLLKGLRYCPDYQPIIEDLRNQAKEGAGEIMQQMQNPGKVEIGSSNLQAWIKDIEESRDLQNALRPENIAAFYKMLAGLQLRDNDIPGIIESYSRILSLTPDDAEAHLQITDILFKIGEYSQGVKHLTRAIELDKSNAVHWESIGDKLFDTGQFNEAIFAYEQCFMALPKNTTLLKKIGDCYIAMDQPEAAKEAYLALKKVLTGEKATLPTIQ
ncbi:MAG: DUF115 domain-containing protein [Proteobacteria bacterium]|nr:DUF115 domain-containing protein [Pseudomonadota bacterium]MBU1737703.1 DUF115 domain-containing protein [Pseudomonadota bacterium]